MPVNEFGIWPGFPTPDTSLGRSADGWRWRGRYLLNEPREGIAAPARDLTESTPTGEEVSMRVGIWLPAVLLGSLPLFLRASVATRAATRQPSESQAEWSRYGGGPDGTRYSSLTQINRSNVSRLRVAWTYDAGE